MRSSCHLEGNLECIPEIFWQFLEVFSDFSEFILAFLGGMQVRLPNFFFVPRRRPKKSIPVRPTRQLPRKMQTFAWTAAKIDHVFVRGQTCQQLLRELLRV